MQEDEFWGIIDEALGEDDPYSYMHQALRQMNCDKILSFQNILTEKLATACTFPLLAANFAIESYVSEDGFRNFRAWLISQGQDRFTRTVANPDSIADWLDRAEVDEIDGEPMLSVAQDAFVEACGDASEFREKLSFEREPVLVQEWPKDKAEYRSKWPKLVDKFWNQERIREIHGE